MLDHHGRAYSEPLITVQLALAASDLDCVSIAVFQQ